MDSPPIGLFTDPVTGARMVIRVNAARIHMIPIDESEDHRQDAGCPCGPTPYRQCPDCSLNLGGSCDTCDGKRFVVPANPLFDTDMDVFYVHNLRSPRGAKRPATPGDPDATAQREGTEGHA